MDHPLDKCGPFPNIPNKVDQDSTGCYTGFVASLMEIILSEVKLKIVVKVEEKEYGSIANSNNPSNWSGAIGALMDKVSIYYV